MKMRVTRLYVNQNLEMHNEVMLDEATLHYAANVLRLNKFSSLTLFNGDGFDYACEILSFSRKLIRLRVYEKKQINNESPLITNLLLAISKSSHMDYAIQKSVEAGVTNIYPIYTERTVYKPNNKSSNKFTHWKRVIVGACEQCGRAQLANIYNAIKFSEINDLNENELGLLLDQNSPRPISAVKYSSPKSFWFIVGPEGGLTNKEIEYAINVKGYQSVRCGPRILRTETAAHTIIISAQLMWGDYL